MNSYRVFIEKRAAPSDEKMRLCNQLEDLQENVTDFEHNYAKVGCRRLRLLHSRLLTCYT